MICFISINCLIMMFVMVIISILVLFNVVLFLLVFSLIEDIEQVELIYVEFEW